MSTSPRRVLADTLVQWGEPGTPPLLVRHGKGEKSRRLPLNDRAKGILARWLAMRPNCDQPYLFTVDYSRRLAENGLAGSRGEARRLIRQGGVRVDGVQLRADELDVARGRLLGAELRVGRRFAVIEA